MKSFWLSLSFLVAGASTSLVYAAGKPQLGSFIGDAMSTTTAGGKYLPPRSDKGQRVGMELRVDRNRLYVSRTEQGRPGWRQSFIVKSDTVLPSGERVIDYIRPLETTRSGKFNRAKIGWLDNMTGSGKVVISGNTIKWFNEGQATVQGHAVAIDWMESFSGQAARAVKVKAAPAPVAAQ